MTIFLMLFLLLGFNALQSKNQPNIMVFLVDDMRVIERRGDKVLYESMFG
jgi:hypothetical protein